MDCEALVAAVRKSLKILARRAAWAWKGIRKVKWCMMMRSSVVFAAAERMESEIVD